MRKIRKNVTPQQTKQMLNIHIKSRNIGVILYYLSISESSHVLYPQKKNYIYQNSPSFASFPPGAPGVAITKSDCDHRSEIISDHNPLARSLPTLLCWQTERTFRQTIGKCIVHTRYPSPKLKKLVNMEALSIGCRNKH